MRRFCLLLTAAILAACGSNPTTNNPPPTPYAVNVFTSTQTDNAPGAGDRTYSVVLKVTDKNTGDSVPNQDIILQISAGSTTPTVPRTGTNGRATVQWVILKADQVSGRTEAMAFCAPGPGQSFCKTSLSDPSSFLAPF
jgi:hypothetical protein